MELLIKTASRYNTALVLITHDETGDTMQPHRRIADGRIAADSRRADTVSNTSWGLALTLARREIRAVSAASGFF